jgi:acyl carrier protein
MEKQEIATILREFILEQSNLADSSVLHDDTNLIEAGILDSLMMASVVWFCEERLNCSLDTADLTEDSCKSITAMSGLISRKHRNTGNLNG